MDSSLGSKILKACTFTYLVLNIFGLSMRTAQGSLCQWSDGDFTLDDAMDLRSLFVFLFSLSLSLAAELEDAQDGSDPYLKFRPEFARSLPVQIMLTGVVLTLVAVLFIHLMFTAQYHWPLAPVNYVLQLSGVTTLLISLIATIHVVLSATFAESEKWPYMLSYIAVTVPPLDLGSTTTDGWSVAERATWLVMNASTSGLIQITHIQFLTLLYPSKLEGRLIFTLLGPLAVVAAIMQLLSISGNDTVTRITTDIRGVCNATLSLLFTLSLFMWGLLVNRKQAWRTDGGTAVFGAAALSLAVISTALNVLCVHKEQEFVWLPGLMWAVVLWQSFLGWWWWVGAGSGGVFSSEDEAMEQKLRREAKRERRKKEARERRKETKLKAQKVWKDVAGAFVPSSGVCTSVSQSDVRSRASITPIAPGSVHSCPTTSDSPSNPAAPRHNHAPLWPDSSLTITGSITSTTQTHITLPRILPGIVHRWYASLRHAHNAAARVQAAERVDRMRELGRMDGDNGEAGNGTGPNGGRRQGRDGGGYFSASTFGWGLGWYGPGWRKRRETYGASAAEKEVGSDKESDGSRSQSASRSRSRGRRRREEREMAASHEMHRWRPATEQDEADNVYLTNAEEDRNQRRQRRRRGVPTEAQTVYQGGEQKARTEGSNTQDPPHQPDLRVAATLPLPAAAERPSSVWWWGPLKRWRLQDSTTY